MDRPNKSYYVEKMYHLSLQTDNRIIELYNSMHLEQTRNSKVICSCFSEKGDLINLKLAFGYPLAWLHEDIAK